MATPTITTDRETYTVTRADRVMFHVPKVGYVVAWLAGPFGLFLLGGYAMFLLSVLFRGRGESRPGDDEPPSEKRDDNVVAGLPCADSTRSVGGRSARLAAPLLAALAVVTGAAAGAKPFGMQIFNVYLYDAAV